MGDGEDDDEPAEEVGNIRGQRVVSRDFDGDDRQSEDRGNSQQQPELDPAPRPFGLRNGARVVRCLPGCCRWVRDGVPCRRWV